MYIENLSVDRKPIKKRLQYKVLNGIMLSNLWSGHFKLVRTLYRVCATLNYLITKIANEK